MRMLIVLLCVYVVGTASAQQKPAVKPNTAGQKQKPAGGKVVLKTVRDKLTYIVGYDVALKMITDIQQKKLDLDSKVFLMAVTDAFEGKKPVLSDMEARNVMQLFDQLMKATPEERERLQKEMFSGK